MSEGEGHPLGLPTRSTKLWKKSVKKEEDYKPLTPHFCPNIIDKATKKKCGRFMRNWDINFGIFTWLKIYPKLWNYLILVKRLIQTWWVS